MNDRLYFRRQFLLARSPIPALGHWTSLDAGPFVLHVHPDLAVERVERDGTVLVLLGSLFDTVDASKSNRDILDGLLADARPFHDCVRALKQFAGCYALLHIDGHDCRMIQDALAVREVYYCTGANLVVCASQPTLLARHADPAIGHTRDPEVLQFHNRDMKGVRNGTLWVGDGTFFEGVRHLLPNHYLDLQTRQPHRYWPGAPFGPLSLGEAVERSCRFLQGCMDAITRRHRVMLAVTAGTDSRTLLAASRAFTDRIYFFINQERHLTRESVDIAVPSRMLASLKVPFHIHQIAAEVPPEFREAFLNNSFLATERILPTIYNYHLHHADKVNVLGVGEIGRNLWGYAPSPVHGYRMAYALGYKRSQYAAKHCDQWLREALPGSRSHSINILTLLLWEQLLGNWGAVGNSESDIAIEEVDPFVSHYLYETFLSVEERYRRPGHSILFREMIGSMWPELLGFPINPPDTIKDKICASLKKIGIYGLSKRARYAANYVLYGRSRRASQTG